MEVRILNYHNKLKMKKNYDYYIVLNKIYFNYFFQLFLLLFSHYLSIISNIDSLKFYKILLIYKLHFSKSTGF